MRYGSPYKRRINFILRQTQEAGFQDLWDNKDKKKISGKNSLKSGGSQNLVPLSIVHLQSAFYVYFIGMGLSLGCFLYEIVKVRYNKCIEKKMEKEHDFDEDISAM